MSEHLDKGNLYDRLNQAIQQTRELVVSMEGLQKMMTQVLEENAALSIENDHLRRLLESQSQKDAGGLTASQRSSKRSTRRAFTSVTNTTESVAMMSASFVNRR